MTLTTAVSNILQRSVTTEEARVFADERYGELAAYIRHRDCRKKIENTEECMKLDAKYGKYGYKTFARPVTYKNEIYYHYKLEI